MIRGALINSPGSSGNRKERARLRATELEENLSRIRILFICYCSSPSGPRGASQRGCNPERRPTWTQNLIALFSVLFTWSEGGISCSRSGLIFLAWGQMGVSKGHSRLRRPRRRAVKRLPPSDFPPALPERSLVHADITLNRPPPGRRCNVRAWKPDGGDGQQLTVLISVQHER